MKADYIAFDPCTAGQRPAAQRGEPQHAAAVLFVETADVAGQVAAPVGPSHDRHHGQRAGLPTGRAGHLPIHTGEAIDGVAEGTAREQAAATEVDGLAADGHRAGSDRSAGRLDPPAKIGLEQFSRIDLGGIEGCATVIQHQPRVEHFSAGAPRALARLGSDKGARSQALVATAAAAAKLSVYGFVAHTMLH